MIFNKQLFRIGIDGVTYTWTVGDEIMHSLWWVVKVMVLGSIFIFVVFSWSEVLVVRWMQGYQQLSYSCQVEINDIMKSIKYETTTD